MMATLIDMDSNDVLKTERKALRSEFEILFDDPIDLLPAEYVHWLEAQLITTRR